MEYALLSMKLCSQTFYIVADRGFAKLDFTGDSPLYPGIHRITRLKKNIYLEWDGICGSLKDWPLYPGEEVCIEKAMIGSRKQVMTGIVLARIEQDCFLAAPSHFVEKALSAYKKRIGIEEQNRDLKTDLGIRSLYFGKGVRIQRLWNILGILSSWMYQIYLQYWEKKQNLLCRKYKDGRKDLSWFTFGKFLLGKDTPLKAWIPFQQIWA